MDYRILIDAMRTTHRANVSQTNTVVRSLFASVKTEADLYSSYESIDDDEIQDRNEYKYYLAIYNVINAFLEQTRFIGDADDFHNLSVEFANNEDEDYACRILEVGLRCFPENVDLLADYLAYCNETSDVDHEERKKRIEQAEEYRQKLNAIPRSSWGWRGFLFSITYLFEQIEGKAQEKLSTDSDGTLSVQDEIKSLISDYKKYIPMDERAFTLEYRLAKLSESSREKLKKILLVVANGETPVRRVPRIAFELAKLYFDEKDYPRTIEMLERCLVDGFSEKVDGEIGEVYLLLGMSKISKYYSDYQASTLLAEDDSEKKATVESIYSCFASYSNSDSHKRDILTLLKVFNIQTGVYNKYDMAANVPTD